MKSPSFCHTEVQERISLLEKALQDQRRVEAVLSRSAAQKEAVMDSLPDRVVYQDTAYRILWANEAACRAVGIDRDRLVGMHCYQAWKGRLTPCGDCPLESGMRGQEGVVSFNEIIAADGRKWVIRACPVRGPSGKTLGIVKVMTDTTGWGLGGESPYREQSFHKTLFESTPAFIVAIDPEGRTLTMNPAMTSALGYKLEEVIGRSYLEHFVPEDEREEVSRVFRGLVDQRRSTLNENRVVGREGREYLVQWHGRPVFREDGSLDFFFGVGVDVTEKKRLEVHLLEAQKMKAVGTLAGGIAHDFNNLLQAIRGYADLLLLDKGPGDPDYQELTEIQRAACSASELTDQLLAFSRKAKSELRPVNLNETVRQVSKILRRTIPEMISVELRLQDDLAFVNADSVQLEQVLMNLALNARDSMPKGGTMTLETKGIFLDEAGCSAHACAEPGEYVVLMVKDTGHGIEPQVFEHIFEPFYTTKDRGEGNGLGLSMVYGIVRNHRGFINCESTPGQGTVFEVYLPAAESPEI
ncbi:MAG: PAS domain S-box protein [Desulfobacteraceae bacterium]